MNPPLDPETLFEEGLQAYFAPLLVLVVLTMMKRLEVLMLNKTGTSAKKSLFYFVVSRAIRRGGTDEGASPSRG